MCAPWLKSMEVRLSSVTGVLTRHRKKDVYSKTVSVICLSTYDVNAKHAAAVLNASVGRASVLPEQPSIYSLAEPCGARRQMGKRYEQARARVYQV